MLKRIFFPTILLLLFYGFYASSDFTAICAGVSIFLFGMMSLEEGFKRFTGGMLEKLLTRFTDKTWKSLTFGIVSTSVMQSSSLVSVLTISFISASLLSLHQGLGIIFGANIGTTTGAWLVAGIGLKVKISNYAMPLLVLGVVCIMQNKKNVKGLGYVLAGVGFLFLGIHYMKEGFDAFRAQIDLTQYAIPGFKGMLVYTLIGILATVVMQSSHATLVLTITALSLGQITYSNGLALAIGSNIGTTITAILGALTSNIAGRRLAAAHVIFNVTTGLVALIFVTQLQSFVDIIAAAVGIGENDYTLKLSVFHTLFNLMGVALMLPLMSLLEKLLYRIIPERERRSGLDLAGVDVDRRQGVDHAIYLEPAALGYADSALNVLIEESQHLFDNGLQVVMQSCLIPNEIRQPGADLDLLVETVDQTKYQNDIDDLYERYVKVLSSEIFEFGAKAQVQFNESQSALYIDLMSSAQRIVEAIKAGKHLNKNMRKHSHSTNQWVAGEYRQLRRVLAEVLAEIYRLRNSSVKDDVLFADRMRIYVEKSDSFSSGELAQHIREGRFPGYMSSSIMNDSRYAAQIASALIDALEIITQAESFGSSGAQELSLDAADISELAEQARANQGEENLRDQ